jgi:hypothetical protein
MGAGAGKVVDIRQPRRYADRCLGEVYLHDPDDGNAHGAADRGDAVDPLYAQARRPCSDDSLGEGKNEVSAIERARRDRLARDD